MTDIRERIVNALRNALEDAPIASWTNWDDGDLPILADAVIEELGLGEPRAFRSFSELHPEAFTAIYPEYTITSEKDYQ